MSSANDHDKGVGIPVYMRANLLLHVSECENLRISAS